MIAVGQLRRLGAVYLGEQRSLLRAQPEILVDQHGEQQQLRTRGIGGRTPQ